MSQVFRKIFKLNCTDRWEEAVDSKMAAVRATIAIVYVFSPLLDHWYSA